MDVDVVWKRRLNMRDGQGVKPNYLCRRYLKQTPVSVKLDTLSLIIFGLIMMKNWI